jgi:hypothetical protein
VYHAETAEQVKRSTRPSKPEARGSDPQAFYYQCDEKFFTAIRDSPVTVEWVKMRDVVGEIPLALVALTRVGWQRAGGGQLGAIRVGQPFGPAESRLQKNPSVDQIFLDFRYKEQIC